MYSFRSLNVVDIIAAIVLVVASIVFVVVNVERHASVSPIDEYVYIDYVAKVPTQGVVRRGEETGEYARDYLACHGVRTLGVYPESLCAVDGAGDDEDFPNVGMTSADIYTPMYPAITWAGAQLYLLLGAEDLVQAGRYTGMLWLAAAALTLFTALRRMGVPALLAFASSLVILASPPVEWSNTYISTDATVLLAGSLMLLLISRRFASSSSRLMAFSVASVLLVLLKVQNIVAVGFAALYLLMVGIIRTARRVRRGEAAWSSLFRDKDVHVAVTMVGLSVAAQLIWLAIRSAIAVDASPDQGVGATLTASALLNEAVKFLPAVLQFPVPYAPPTAQAAVAAIGSLLAAAGVIGLACARKLGSRQELLGVSVLVVAAGLGPLLAVLTYITAGYYFVLPVRYGLVLAPLCIAALALLIGRKQWPSVVLAAFGAISFIAMVPLGAAG